MPRAAANGIELEYQVFGTGEPLYLIMGIGAQMIHWPDGFCERLAAEGFRVVRFDNRDAGGSTRLRDRGAPALPRVVARWLAGLEVAAPYTLSDMALDTAALMEALGDSDAHVVGASMGGMIAQTLAIERPERVRTLTSMMSTNGQRRHFLGQPQALAALLGPAPRSEQEAVEYEVRFWKTVSGRGFPFDEAAVRARAARAYQRGTTPDGFLRQFAAIAASGSRRDRLSAVRAPTLVIHGSDDPLIPPRAGRAVAEGVQDARFMLVRGMGHDLPRGTWERLARAIGHHTTLRARRSTDDA